MHGRSPSQVPSGPILIVPELFTAEHASRPVDMICCRHVLEHLSNPLALLRTIRGGIGNRKTGVSFEVPNGAWIFRDLNVWDVIYEHCFYFTPESLIQLFRRAGFEPIDISEHYGHQYLTIDAAPANSAQPPTDDRVEDRDRAQKQVAHFATGAKAKIEDWKERISEMAGRDVIVWGAGSKGVTFLNVVDVDAGVVHRTVDVNPRKQGKFIPGSGQLVIDPHDLTIRPPDIAIVTNPIYRGEIRAMLRKLDLRPKLMTV